jgi:hypothetical protein
MFIALYKDLLVSHVFDLTPSCPAACGAAVLGISYEGVGMSERRANWLNHIVDKIIFAILADKDDDNAKDIRKDIACYFSAMVDEGRFFLKSNKDGNVEESDADGPEEEGRRKQETLGVRLPRQLLVPQRCWAADGFDCLGSLWRRRGVCKRFLP